MEAQKGGRIDKVIVFPFMAKGHTIPLLHLSSALSARGVSVTIITTPLNSSFILQSFPESNQNLTLSVLPFPAHPSLPDNCESTDHLPNPTLIPIFLQATELLRIPFRDFLHSLFRSNSLPLCVISDFFLGWTLEECNNFNIPRVVFHGMGIFSMMLCKSLSAIRPKLAVDRESFHVKGTPEGLLLSPKDVPDVFKDNSLPPLLIENEKADLGSCGVLINSFHGLEGEFLPYLEAFYKNSQVRTWLAGPLCLFHHPVPTRDSCMVWLEGRLPGSVVYVSFGTQAHVSEEQMEEVMQGLVMSGLDFILVASSSIMEDVPPGRGLVVHGWVPQREVLLHSSTGGFLSHCGWNSVLESLSAGVPILAWPLIAEQGLNARLVVCELGAGLRVGSGSGGVVRRGEICESVKDLMIREKGKEVRKRAKELGEMAMASVENGGSSDLGLTKFVEDIRLAANGLAEAH